MNIISGIATKASARPDQPAVIDGDRVLTYAGLIAAVAEIGGRLQSVGIRPGDGTNPAATNPRKSGKVEAT